MRLHDVEFDDDELLKLWESGQPGSRIAADLGIRTHELHRLWRYLKRIGKIPPGERAFHARDTTADPYDGRPKVVNPDIQGGTYDPLLDRLRQEHGDKQDNPDGQRRGSGDDSDRD